MAIDPLALLVAARAFMPAKAMELGTAAAKARTGSEIEKLLVMARDTFQSANLQKEIVDPVLAQLTDDNATKISAWAGNKQNIVELFSTIREYLNPDLVSKVSTFVEQNITDDAIRPNARLARAYIGGYLDSIKHAAKAVAQTIGGAVDKLAS